MRESRGATTSIRIPGDEESPCGVLPRSCEQNRSQRDGEASCLVATRLPYDFPENASAYLDLTTALSVSVSPERARSKLNAATFNLYTECLIKIAGTWPCHRRKLNVKVIWRELSVYHLVFSTFSSPVSFFRMLRNLKNANCELHS